jgi:hypothetical protein
MSPALVPSSLFPLSLFPPSRSPAPLPTFNGDFTTVHDSTVDSLTSSDPFRGTFRSVPYGQTNKQTNKQTNNHRSTGGDGPTCLTNERENARPDPTDPADPALVWFFGLNECERRSATTRCCRTTTESVVRSGRNGDARKTADAPAHTHAHRRATTTTTTT